MKKYDKILIGVAVGFLLPLVAFAIIMLVQYNTSARVHYIGAKYLIHLSPKILSVCVCANLLPFYYFLNSERMAAVHGVVTATIALALISLILFLTV